MNTFSYLDFILSVTFVIIAAFLITALLIFLFYVIMRMYDNYTSNHENMDYMRERLLELEKWLPQDQFDECQDRLDAALSEMNRAKWPPAIKFRSGSFDMVLQKHNCYDCYKIGRILRKAKQLSSSNKAKKSLEKLFEVAKAYFAEMSLHTSRAINDQTRSITEAFEAICDAQFSQKSLGCMLENPNKDQTIEHVSRAIEDIEFNLRVAHEAIMEVESTTQQFKSARKMLQ